MITIIKTLKTASLASAVIFSMAPSAFARPDLTFVHNASPYFVWSNLTICNKDLKDAGYRSGTFGNKSSYCGKYLYSTESTIKLAKFRWKRHDNIQLYYRSSNKNFCKITP